MINSTMKASVTKLKGFNAMLLLQLLLLLEKHHKLNCTMNLALNDLNSGDRWEGFVCSIKSKHLRNLNICIIEFQMIIKLITLETYILLKLTFPEQMYLNIYFFPLPFPNWTNLTQTCAMRNHTQHSENRYWRWFSQAKFIFTKSMIL